MKAISGQFKYFFSSEYTEWTTNLMIKNGTKYGKIHDQWQNLKNYAGNLHV